MRFFALLVLFLAAVPGIALEAKRPNVLFIAVDDLRPIMGCFGEKTVKTPHMDALAARGTVFLRAYCQQAVCSPSRTSLLTGRRPDTTKVYDLETHFRKTLPDVVTLPQHFKRNGYHTEGMGKILHGNLDDAPSWTVPPAPTDGFDPPRAPDGRTTGPRGPAWRAAEEPDSELTDVKIADRAIAALSRLKEKPFFLAVGFHKPHLPFVAPKRYYDLYPPEKIPRPKDYHAPENAPKVALHNSGELRQYRDIPKQQGVITEEKAKELIRGYYAAVTYVDDQIGRVLKELDRLGLREKTVVVLWGDHGWHLGEHGFFCKHSNFEVATRAPLIVTDPRRPKGVKTRALVEFIDIYPTLCELAGLPNPDGLEGKSFAPLLERPDQPWKKAAFSQYPRANGVMGYSMRTDRHRYTEWRGPNGDVRATELYDHETDPGENENVAGRPEARELAAKLGVMMKGMVGK